MQGFACYIILYIEPSLEQIGITSATPSRIGDLGPHSSSLGDDRRGRFKQKAARTKLEAEEEGGGRREERTRGGGGRRQGEEGRRGGRRREKTWKEGEGGEKRRE